jgi:hypothetical protein
VLQTCTSTQTLLQGESEAQKSFCSVTCLRCSPELLN